VSVPPALLERLGIRSEAPQAHLPEDGRKAAFLNTTSQCVEIIQSCFRRLENTSEPMAPILEAYLRGLKTLSAAAQYRDSIELEEPVALQLQILDAAMKSGTLLSSEDRSRLGDAFQRARSVVDSMSRTATSPRFLRRLLTLNRQPKIRWISQCLPRPPRRFESNRTSWIA